MYGYGYYGWGMDPTILLLVIGMLLSLAASAKLRSTFAVYKKVRSHSGITGAEAAQRILRAAGITDVQVVPIRGGTDGARLSYEGLPCPNLSTGGLNFDSVHEFSPVEALERMTRVLIRLAQ